MSWNSAGSISLSWVGNPAVHLQSATNLAAPTFWADVPNTAGQRSTTIPTTAPKLLFRLVTP